MKGELVFVPIFGQGDGKTIEWASMPHIKAWGLFDGDDVGGDLIMLHAEPMSSAITIGGRVRLFDEELAAMERNPTDVPEIVSVRLAQLALAPHTLQLAEANS